MARGVRIAGERKEHRNWIIERQETGDLRIRGGFDFVKHHHFLNSPL
jgi:hypothetical protein